MNSKNETASTTQLTKSKSSLSASASLWRDFKNSPFFIKLTNWEYWSLYVANIPLIFIWLWFALRARRLFFFTAVNPVIETGGAWGESKFDILHRIPERYKPITLFIANGTAFSEVILRIKEAGLVFPIIAKPNIGERGLKVSRLKEESALKQYIAGIDGDFLVQEYVDLPLELAVMHHRFPNGTKGGVTSICIKDTLKVTGDGLATVKQLMKNYPRARFQLPRFETDFPDMLDQVPSSGTTIVLEPIGNHCRGTKFLNGNEYIDASLCKVFDAIGSEMDGIYYGRFDMKCRSIEDLKSGGSFKVMEYNGIGAEPAHIYDPSYPVFKKYEDIYHHWKIIYKIYRQQKSRGYNGMSLMEAIRSLKKYAAYKMRVNKTMKS